jgi:hypothetical protein
VCLGRAYVVSSMSVSTHVCARQLPLRSVSCHLQQHTAQTLGDGDEHART